MYNGQVYSSPASMTALYNRFKHFEKRYFEFCQWQREVGLALNIKSPESESDDEFHENKREFNRQILEKIETILNSD